MNNSEYYKWYPLEEFPDSNYEINKMGQIRNIKTGRILNGTKDNWGYKSYTLRYNNKNYHRIAHIMVAKQFIPNPDNMPIINHKDENKMNPCVDNLEWTTIQKNSKHGTTQERRSVKLERPINEYSLDGKYIRTWRSMIAITEYIVENNNDIDFEKMYSYVGHIIRFNSKNIDKRSIDNSIFKTYDNCDDIIVKLTKQRKNYKFNIFGKDKIISEMYLYDLNNKNKYKYKIDILKQILNNLRSIDEKEAVEYAIECVEKICEIKEIINE